MLKKLLAVSLVAILVLTGCNYTEAWIEILSGDIVNTSFEISYQIDEEWANYFVDEAQRSGGEEAKLKRQEQLGYKSAKVKATLDYKQRVGQVEVTLFNAFNPEKTTTMNFYVQGAKVFIPIDLITKQYTYSWTEEEQERIQKAMQGKDYMMFNMDEEYGYHYALRGLMTGNEFMPLTESQEGFEEIFWAKRGGDLEELLLFFKNLDIGIKKEGQDYILDLNFLEAVNQSENILCYIIDNVKKEDKAFINKYYDLDDEDFEEILTNKEELKANIQSGYDWIRDIIEEYGMKPIFDASTINAKWHLLKGTNQEVEIKVVVPVDIIKEYEIEGPENIPFTASGTYIQNMNKESTVTIQIPDQYVSGNEIQKVYEEIQEEHEEKYREQYEEERKKYTVVYNEQELSYVWENGIYYYNARELSGFFEEEISYKKGKLYLKKGDESIDVNHKIVHGSAYVEESILNKLGYKIELEYNGDQATGYSPSPINYFIISKENQTVEFAGKPILQLTLGENYEVHRSESDCKDLGWQVLYNGEEVLTRAADDELSIRYFAEGPGEYEVCLIRWSIYDYESISNVIKYTIE